MYLQLSLDQEIVPIPILGIVISPILVVSVCIDFFCELFRPCPRNMDIVAPEVPACSGLLKVGLAIPPLLIES